MLERTVRDDNWAAQSAIENAGAALAGRRADIPANFVERIFGRVVPEDVVRYGADDLAALAERAYDFLAEREPGTPKIRCETVRLTASGERTAVTVVEIVNDDMPFLVDSVMGEIADRRLDVRLVSHPVLGVRREGGKLVALGAADAVNAAHESYIHIHLEPIDDETARADLVRALDGALGEVKLAVQDWRPMLERVNGIVAELKTNPPPLPVDEIAEAIQFLQWLLADNFTFLGVRDYAVVDGSTLEPNFDSSLGIMRSRELRVLKRGEDQLEFTPEIMAFLKEPRPLIIAKANIHARVHRRVYLDYVGVKRFDAAGTLVGEFRIIGLFTSTAYTRTAHSIPYLRRKIASVEARAGFDPNSHSGKSLASVLEHYPRDELFQIDEDTLYHFALAILQLDERPRVRVLARHDRFDRFVSVLVYVPRERYDSDIRVKIGDYLASAFIGRVTAFYPFFPEGPLVRVHFIIGRSGGASPQPERAKLESEVVAIVRTWIDGLVDALALVNPPEKARELLERYRDAFSEGFHEFYSPVVAASDIRIIEGLTEQRPLAVDFRHRNEEEQQSVSLRVWSLGRPLPLSERVPVLENMGFKVVDERTYRITPQGASRLWFHDMLLERNDGGMIDLSAGKTRLEAAFLMVMRGVAENDGYNALTLSGGLAWRDVALIRTLSRFLRQIRVPYSQDYMWATLVKHAAVAGDVVELFHARLDPRPGAAEGRDEKQNAIAARIEEELQKVESLDEDRILRHFVNAVQSAIRTNFYQTDNEGKAKALIAVKFESGKLTDLPLPRPLYEIFVYSPRVEGVHMRFGKVARGGIRWSDRPQDFRTEVLGLVKAQQVKNAVIVPVGAKGGFVPKLMSKGATRDVVQAEGIATYKLFMSTLLDITDNFSHDGKIIPPNSVVRHEGDDPYLVVAADKGTATFSDIANDIAVAHDYWLGDAFASGGSAGYDHKVMGITARGAWEAVKRALPRDGRRHRRHTVQRGRRRRHVGRRVRQRPAARGDDAAGRGLRPPRHLHRSRSGPEGELRRAQAAVRAAALELAGLRQIADSKGGGVYPRASKEIHLSPEAQKLFGVAAAVTPQDLMKAVLTARVDLLFFGGIGTYIRASSETDEAAGDRANDAIRITGADLRCKVIGEGANLGMTQRGRIEAALAGIRLNTDAIDNSAGVNTSDVEVNIKIALSDPVRSGALTLEARNALLAEMTNEVARLVLRNNYQQTLALSLAQRRGLEDFGFQQRLMQTLGKAGAARSCGRIPARRNRAGRPPQAQPAADAAGARGALGLRQAHALQRVAQHLGAGRSLSGARTQPLFPQGNDRALRRRAASPSAAARDHRHPAHQLDDQSRRRHADRTHRRSDRRRAGRDRGGLCRGAQQLRHGRAQQRDRCARQQAVGQDAARSLRHGSRSIARQAGLVPAQRRPQAGAGDHHRALPRRHRAGGGCARRRAVEVGG